MLRVPKFKVGFGCESPYTCKLQSNTKQRSVAGFFGLALVAPPPHHPAVLLLVYSFLTLWPAFVLRIEVGELPLAPWRGQRRWGALRRLPRPRGATAVGWIAAPSIV